MSEPGRLHRRVWSFADCVFDEANRTLTVAGRRVQIEIKPLELLRELLLHDGNLVSKEELLDAIWPDVVVVEASLATAVRKLRSALNDDERRIRLIETVPRIGYRLTARVEMKEFPASRDNEVGPRPEAAPPRPGAAAPSPVVRLDWTRNRTRISMAGTLALVIGATAIALLSSRGPVAALAAPAFTQRDAMNALRRLDVAEVEQLLAAGWDPNVEIRAEGNAALHFVVEMCEWNPEHDRQRMVLIVRTLQDGGARLEQRNVWGDTPYSIAKSPRYCGPNHLVTRSIRATCTRDGVVADYCMASYELARRDGVEDAQVSAEL